MKAKIEVFDRDAAANDGYVYTTAQRLSSRLATRKLSDLILGAVDFEGRTVLDIGCGDGYFTERYWDEGRPERIVGVDPAPAAVKVAQERRPDAGMTFVVGDGHRLPWRDGSFDLALIQGVLHHDDRPVETIREARARARQLDDEVPRPGSRNRARKRRERTGDLDLENPAVVGLLEAHAFERRCNRLALPKNRAGRPGGKVHQHQETHEDELSQSHCHPASSRKRTRLTL